MVELSGCTLERCVFDLRRIKTNAGYSSRITEFSFDEPCGSPSCHYQGERHINCNHTYIAFYSRSLLVTLAASHTHHRLGVAGGMRIRQAHVCYTTRDGICSIHADSNQSVVNSYEIVVQQFEAARGSGRSVEPAGAVLRCTAAPCAVLHQMCLHYVTWLWNSMSSIKALVYSLARRQLQHRS